MGSSSSSQTASTQLPRHNVYYIVPMCQRHNRDRGMEEGCGEWQRLKAHVRPVIFKIHPDVGGEKARRAEEEKKKKKKK